MADEVSWEELDDLVLRCDFELQEHRKAIDDAVLSGDSNVDYEEYDKLNKVLDEYQEVLNLLHKRAQEEQSFD